MTNAAALIWALLFGGEGGGGGGGEPSAYIKNAAVSSDGLTLTLTKKNGSTVTFNMTDVVNTINAAISALQTSVAGKQDTIADLETIRTNAAAVAGKQDTISDLTDIRNNAAVGADAYNSLADPLSYITLEAEDSDTHEVTRFNIYGTEVFDPPEV